MGFLPVELLQLYKLISAIFAIGFSISAIFAISAISAIFAMGFLLV